MKDMRVRLWYPKLKQMSVTISIWNLPDLDEVEEEPVVLRPTELKDKKGKEIYEGDIVRDKWEEIKEEQYIDYEIKWDTKKARFYAHNVDKFANGLEMDELIDVEIIGNIYEDSHLLEETNVKRD